MIYGNIFLEKSGGISDLKFNNPKELYNWMKSNIRYSNFYELKSAQEVYESKCGSCHDQVMFEDYFFMRQFNLKYSRLFAIEYKDGENKGGRTHSFIYYIDNDKYYWFENSWPSNKGINGPYNSLNELKNDFIDKMLSETKRYNKVLIRTVKGVKPGMTLNQYVNACIGG